MKQIFIENTLLPFVNKYLDHFKEDMDKQMEATGQSFEAFFEHYFDLDPEHKRGITDQINIMARAVSGDSYQLYPNLANSELTDELIKVMNYHFKTKYFENSGHFLTALFPDSSGNMGVEVRDQRYLFALMLDRNISNLKELVPQSYRSKEEYYAKKKKLEKLVRRLLGTARWEQIEAEGLVCSDKTNTITLTRDLKIEIESGFAELMLKQFDVEDMTFVFDLESFDLVGGLKVKGQPLKNFRVNGEDPNLVNIQNKPHLGNHLLDINGVAIGLAISMPNYVQEPVVNDATDEKAAILNGLPGPREQKLTGIHGLSKIDEDHHSLDEDGRQNEEKEVRSMGRVPMGTGQDLISGHTQQVIDRSGPNVEQELALHKAPVRYKGEPAKVQEKDKKAKEKGKSIFSRRGERDRMQQEQEQRTEESKKDGTRTSQGGSKKDHSFRNIAMASFGVPLIGVGSVAGFTMLDIVSDNSDGTDVLTGTIGGLSDFIANILQLFT